MKVQHPRGIGSRYDALTPNAIDRERSTPVVLVTGGKRWCCKCQKDKPILGSVKRGGLVICGDCK